MTRAYVGRVCGHPTAQPTQWCLPCWKAEQRRRREARWPGRFWAMVDRSGDCWLWTGARASTRQGRQPYGHLQAPDRRYRPAHAVAYELTVGPIPSGLVIDHLCRNTLCVNPAHLEPVTNRENVIVRGQGLFANRARQTHCLRGHEFTDENVVRSSRGTRECRTCRIERDRRRHAERAA